MFTSVVSDTGIWLFHTTLSRTFCGPAEMKAGQCSIERRPSRPSKLAECLGGKWGKFVSSGHHKMNSERCLGSGNEGTEEGSSLDRCSIG